MLSIFCNREQASDWLASNEYCRHDLFMELDVFQRVPPSRREITWACTERKRAATVHHAHRSSSLAGSDERRVL